MSLEIRAIYENGLFRPLESVTLDEHATVSLIVRSSSEKQEAVSCHNSADDFETQLDSLLFDGPSLPADFSRADIYSDHD
ncbi:MAG: antitoxin family protein [Bythopirellula sp.]|nr:antitoxin family protein [Bythopirellula sp.]